VTISARAAELKGRGVVFEITATDGAETVCRGRHSRFVVDVAKTRERLRAKRAKQPA
jgi:predicted thioesterase